MDNITKISLSTNPIPQSDDPVYRQVLREVEILYPNRKLRSKQIIAWEVFNGRAKLKDFKRIRHNKPSSIMEREDSEGERMIQDNLDRY